MTDLEISKALALAIGWPEKGMYASKYQTLVVPIKYPMDNGTFLNSWREFDYRDWNVIGPIAERYDAFPYQSPVGGWVSCCHYADTPQKAIAMAVIEGSKK